MPSKLPALDREVIEAYEYCRDLTRREAKNWYYGFISLPAEKRRAIYAAYAFSRECDDDSDTDGSIESKRAAVERTRRRLDEAYSGRTEDPILVALSDAVHRYDIPREYFEELIAGACTAVMQGIYREILDRMEAAEYDVFAGRTSLTGFEKLGLTARVWLGSFKDELGHRVAALSS
jgi:phytoene/squalene synthetase